ncbi:MAG: NYN domain-containing protein [Planctomycetota bacterium]
MALTGKGLILIDGSYLFCSITRLRTKGIIADNMLLNISTFSGMLLGKWLTYINEAVRVTYYFRKNDERIGSLLYIPEFDKPGAKCHWEIIECADTVSTIPSEEINKLSPKWRDSFARGEKGLDMRIACDSLSIAAMGRIHNFVFMINDRDYLPLLESIKRFGCCTYITSLDTESPQDKLLKAADYYIDMKEYINKIFVKKG